MNFDDFLKKINVGIDLQEDVLKEIKNIDLYEDDEDDIDENLSSNIDELIPGFSSEKLCNIIVCYRYINYDEQLAIKCMNELSKRRVNGDNFDFESKIEDALKQLPALNFEVPDVRTFFTQMIGKNK